MTLIVIILKREISSENKLQLKDNVMYGARSVCVGQKRRVITRRKITTGERLGGGKMEEGRDGVI